MRAALLAGTLFALVLSASETRAEDESPSAAADRHFRRGVALFDERSLVEAANEFELAYRAAPDYRVLFNIGQVRYQLGDHAAAYEAFRRYLADGGDRVAADRRALVENELRGLERLVAKVRIVVDTRDARVSLDGRPIGTGPLATVVVINPGRHEVTAVADGRAPASSTVDAPPGSVTEAALHVVEPPPSIEPPRSTERADKLGYVLVGSGATFLVASLVTDLVFTANAIDDFDAKRDRDAASAADARDTARTLQTISLVGYVVSAVFLAGGATVLVWPKKKSGPAAAAFRGLSSGGVFAW
jgi:hypothetical protein